jgi:hypothetical protein
MSWYIHMFKKDKNKVVPHVLERIFVKYDGHFQTYRGYNH